MNRLYFYTLSFLLWATAAANAQQLTLSEACNIALKQNLDIQIEKNNLEVTDISNHIGLAGGLPVVSAQVNDQESLIAVNQKLNSGVNINRNGILSNNLNGNITGGWLLYNGNRVKATKKRLETLEQQSRQILNAQIQNTLAAVTVKYFEVVRQQALLKTLQKSRDLSQQQLDIVNTRKEVGLASETDLLQSKIDRNTREQEILSQLMVISQAKTDLCNLLQIRPDSNIVISDSIRIEDHLSLNEVLNGIQNNPEILALEQQIKINECLEKEAAALRKPSLNSIAGLNYFRSKAGAGQLLLNQSYGPFVGIGIAIPIYNGGNSKRQQQMASVRTQTAKLQKENELSDAQATASKVFQAYMSGLEQLNAQKQILDMNEKLVTISMQKFQLTSATIIEVREVQRNYEDAGFRMINMLYMTKLAETELKRLSNTISL